MPFSLAERATSGAGGSGVNERIALDGKRFRPSQVHLTVIVPFILADNLHTAVEAQLSKAVVGHDFLFVAAVYMPSPLGGQFTVAQEFR